MESIKTVSVFLYFVLILYVNADSQIETIKWTPATAASAPYLMGTAFVGGREGWDNSPLWIIRANHSGNLLPGKLPIEHQNAYVPFDGKEVRVDNYEVLCTPENLVRWVKVNNGTLPPGAIEAGSTDTAQPLYICRVKHRTSLTPGKVDPIRCCIISFAGSEVSYCEKYEVLCAVKTIEK